MNNSKFILCSLFSVLCFLFSGCNSQTANPQNFNIVSFNGHFPKELVGTWKADNQPWQFTFNKKGNMVSFIYYLGGVRITPSQIKKPVTAEEYIIYEPGQCFGQYTSDSRELAIHIEMNISIGTLLQGNPEDMLVGKISDDFSTWTTEWFSDPQLYGIDDKGNKTLVPPDRPADVPVTLIFKKLSEEELKRYEDVKPVAPHPAHE